MSSTVDYTLMGDHELRQHRDELKATIVKAEAEGDEALAQETILEKIEADRQIHARWNSVDRFSW
jgi:hypothetical protein